MKQSTFLSLLFVMLVGGGALIYWQYMQHKAVRVQQSVMEQQPAPTTQEPQEPTIQYPVPKTPPSHAPENKPPVVEEPLPSLEDSDPAFKKEFGRLFDQELFGKLFIFQQFVNRFVITVDNLTAAKLPKKYQVIKSPHGHFLASGNSEEHQFIDPANYRRYDLYVQFMEAIDTKTIAAVYVRYYPLFQQAYEKLGYPNQYFNDRLIEVIDNLLAAPEVTTPVELVRPSVYYKYADPNLEALSAGQKILIRMGPDNALKVKAKLRELRQILATLSSNL
jgi:hypothetical protein